MYQIFDHVTGVEWSWRQTYYSDSNQLAANSTLVDLSTAIVEVQSVYRRRGQHFVLWNLENESFLDPAGTGTIVLYTNHEYVIRRIVYFTLDEGY
jgi:hypothetical protein